MNLQQLLEQASSLGASDLHITVGVPPIVRINGELKRLGADPLGTADTQELLENVMNDEQKVLFGKNGEVDFSFSYPSIGRFRASFYRQRGSYAAAIRLVASVVPSAEDLRLPQAICELAEMKRGLVLVTGPTGSGKSTTLAAMVDMINQKRSEHIITLEDPIEYLHRHGKSIVNQREIGLDSISYSNALRASLRQDPDVILIGEMRDMETISTAVTAAETGHLVLSTLHTMGAANTIDRIIDVFPPHHQQQIRIQLSNVLQGVISQQLLPTADGKKRIAAFEILTATPAVRNIIREAKIHQIQSVMQTGQKYGMQTMDSCLAEYCRRGLITRDTGLQYAIDQESMQKVLSMYL